MMDALPLDVKHRVLLQLTDLSSGRATTQQVVQALGAIERTSRSWREAVQLVSYMVICGLHQNNTAA